MSETKKTRQLQASDLLNIGHPLHEAFVKFCGDNEPTKRQARKFLSKYPQYRAVEVEIE